MATKNWRMLAIARPDPMMSFMWDITLTAPGINIKSEYFEEVTVPIPSFQVDYATDYTNIKKHYAKELDYGTISIKFYEDAKGTMLRELIAWRNRIKDKNGNWGCPADYQGTMELTPQGPDGVASFVVKYKKVFPTQISQITFNGENDRITYTVEFSLNYSEFTFS